MGVALAMFFGGAALGWLLVKAGPVEPMRGFVKNLDPVELYLQNGYGVGTSFRIPAAYMQWREDRNGGNVGGMIALIVVYPDMTPYALLSRDERRKFEEGNISEDELRFDPLIRLASAVPESLELKFSDVLLEENIVADLAGGGLVQYRATRLGVTKDYLTPTPPAQQKQSPYITGPVFECVPIQPGTERHTRCIVNAQFSDRLLLSYSIPRRSIDQWQEVDDRIRSLVKSYIAGCFEGPVLKGDDEIEQLHACEF